MKCYFPVTIKNPVKVMRKHDLAYIPVPCGKCLGCKRNRINQWLFRLLEQQKCTLTSYFVTLTYGDNDKPGFIESPNGLNTLRPKDLQDYWKRVRKAMPGVKISYYAVGEYGTKRYRPHYHAIVFAADKDILIDKWTHGHVHVGDVNAGSITYTLKYMQKEKTVPAHALDDRVPEFSHWSKGLGTSYITPQIIAYHRADYLERRCVVLPGGIKSVMPKSFLKKIFTPAQLAHQREHIISLIPEEAQMSFREQSEALKALSSYNLDPERNIIF